MNTEDDWKREKAEARPCRCQGRGWITDPNAPSGGIPCGCDRDQGDRDDDAWMIDTDMEAKG